MSIGSTPCLRMLWTLQQGDSHRLTFRVLSLSSLLRWQVIQSMSNDKRHQVRMTFECTQMNASTVKGSQRLGWLAGQTCRTNSKKMPNGASQPILGPLSPSILCADCILGHLEGMRKTNSRNIEWDGNHTRPCNPGQMAPTAQLASETWGLVLYPDSDIPR